MTRRWGTLAVVALALTACPGEAPRQEPEEDPAVPRGADASDVLAATSARLGEITSGSLSLRLTVSREGRGDRVGMEVAGPFMMAPGEVPVARFTSVRLMGEERLSARMFLSGREVFVERDGELRPVEVGRAPPAGGVPGVEALTLERWVDQPSVDEGPRVDGTPTERITGRVRAAAAVSDLLVLAGRFGPAGLALAEADAEHLGRAVRGADVEILTGRDDRLLRRLDLRLRLGMEDEEAALDRVSLRFEVELEEVNERVEAPVPEGAGPEPGPSP